MTILVTGAAGFIGSNVARLLLDQDREVVGVDNLNSSYDARLKNWRLEGLRSYLGFSFHRMDLVDRIGLGELFSRKKFEAVINLAARAGVRQSLEDPWAYYETNLTGTMNLLDLCRNHDVRKLILASTSSVYGTTEGMFHEEGDTDRPLSPYAASKKAAEGLCYAHHYSYGTDIIIPRYFTVYGPAGRPDMSYFRFIRWIAEEEPLIVYGDGSQSRDFTYVDDIARGTVLGLGLEGYNVINLGSDRPVSLSGVIGILEGLLGKEAKVRYEPANPLDVPATWADITRARSLLAWEPQVSLEEGLHIAVEWYLENRIWVSEMEL
jgi:UDP-glucuronate 4-epimerase